MNQKAPTTQTAGETSVKQSKSIPPEVQMISQTKHPNKPTMTIEQPLQTPIKLTNKPPIKTTTEDPILTPTINPTFNHAAMKSAMKRNLVRDRRKSVRTKKIRKEKHHCERESEILESHIPYGSDATKSPHILINKWFHRLRDNSIILKKTCEEGNLKDRQIQYEIEYIGPNIIYKAKRNYLNLELENTKQKWVLVLVR